MKANDNTQPVYDKIKSVNAAQYRIDLKAQIGASPNSIMKSEKSLLANAMGGWAVSLDISNGNDLSEILETTADSFGKEKLSRFARETAFLYAIGLAADFNITFDDADELKEHPLFGDKVDLTFNDVKTKLIGGSGEGGDPLTSWKQDLSAFNEADFDDQG